MYVNLINTESRDATQIDDNDNVFKSVENYLVCDDDRIISHMLRCNGIFDCEDKSDEIDCSYSGEFLASDRVIVILIITFVIFQLY